MHLFDHLSQILVGAESTEIEQILNNVICTDRAQGTINHTVYRRDVWHQMVLSQIFTAFVSRGHD